jgi:hypothetical protein
MFRSEPPVSLQPQLWAWPQVGLAREARPPPQSSGLTQPVRTSRLSLKAPWLDSPPKPCDAPDPGVPSRLQRAPCMPFEVPQQDLGTAIYPQASVNCGCIGLTFDLGLLWPPCLPASKSGGDGVSLLSCYLCFPISVPGRVGRFYLRNS